MKKKPIVKYEVNNIPANYVYTVSVIDELRESLAKLNDQIIDEMGDNLPDAQNLLKRFMRHD